MEQSPFVRPNGVPPRPPRAGREIKSPEQMRSLQGGHRPRTTFVNSGSRTAISKIPEPSSYSASRQTSEEDPRSAGQIQKRRPPKKSRSVIPYQDIRVQSVDNPDVDGKLIIQADKMIVKFGRESDSYFWTELEVYRGTDTLRFKEKNNNGFREVRLSHNDSVRFRDIAREYNVTVHGSNDSPLFNVETKLSGLRSPAERKFDITSWSTSLPLPEGPDRIRRSPLPSSGGSITALRGKRSKDFSALSSDGANWPDSSALASSPPRRGHDMHADDSSPIRPQRDEAGSEAISDASTLEQSATPVRRSKRLESVKSGTKSLNVDLLASGTGSARLDPTPRDERVIERKGYHAFKYKFQNGRGVDISLQDIARLRNNIFLNDAMIMFFLKLAMDRLQSDAPEMAAQVLLFNTYFYTKVVSGDDPSRWMGKEPIENKDIFIIPIHKSLHWTVAVVSGLLGPPGPESTIRIVLFDSLGFISGSTAKSISSRIKTIINKVFKTKNLEPPSLGSLKVIVAETPVQTNSSDCGVYVVHFMEQVLRNPQEFISIIRNVDSDIWADTQYWRPQELQTKRSTLLSTIEKLSGGLRMKEDTPSSSGSTRATPAAPQSGLVSDPVPSGGNGLSDSDEVDVVAYVHKTPRRARTTGTGATTRSRTLAHKSDVHEPAGEYEPEVRTNPSEAVKHRPIDAEHEIAHSLKSAFMQQVEAQSGSLEVNAREQNYTDPVPGPSPYFNHAST